MASRALGIIDKMFVYGESRETMMHVAGLLVFTPPDNAGPHFVRDLVADIFANSHVEPPWNMRLATPNFLFNPAHKWVIDENFDLDYHVRHSALPAPGGERELGKLVSRLHSHPIDFNRPPWELHIIEGLEGGRFALYAKTHHALVDGYTAMRVMARSLSHSPDERQKPMYFAIPEPKREQPPKQPKALLEIIKAIVSHGTSSIGDMGAGMVRLIKSTTARDPDLMTPLQAPPCLLNQRIGRNRRFATQQFDIPRLRVLAKAAGGTLNDVVVALCAGSLRRYLLDADELPGSPLVSFLPVNIRPKGDEGGGNAVGAILVSMATDIESASERLRTIIASTTRAKTQLQGLTQTAIMDYSMLLMMPYILQFAQAMTGNRIKVPVNFNLCISNVPGPEKTMYLRGARMDAVYPVSIPVHSNALNITVQSYAGHLDVGFIGCRDSIPHLQKLAVYSAEALDELEYEILGIGSKKPAPKARTTAAKKPTAAAKKPATPAKKSTAKTSKGQTA
jgi:diacylglycerol O-acyltransferase / wax synthase